MILCMLKTKKFLFVSLFSLLCISFFAQETDDNNVNDAETPETEAIEQTSENDSNIKGEEFHKATTFLDAIQSLDLVLQLEPGVYLNPHKTNSDGQLVSAPSPIVYPISIGILWPNYTFIAMQPTLSFFMMNHLWYDGMALPAEIENRTTTTLSFMLNIPVVFSLYLPNNRLQLGGGVGVFMRFGLRSPGVNDSDSGYTGTAGGDVSEINAWFWNDLHWLYLTTSFSWLINANEKLKIGPTFNAYIPVGTIFKDKSTEGLLISVGFKICR